MLVSSDRLLLAKNIRFLRKRKRMSVVKFAQYIEASPLEVYCLEKELNDSIHWKPLVNLGEIYGIPSDEVLSVDLEEKYKNKRFRYSR